MTKNSRAGIGAIAGLSPMILVLTLLRTPPASAGASFAPAGGPPQRSGSALECDVPYTSSLGGSQTDELSFGIAEGEIISFVVEKIDPSNPGFDPEWRLIRADGTPAMSCGLWNAQRAVDCGPLPASGSPYRMQIRDRQQDAFGTYKVNLQRLAAADACDQIFMHCGDWIWSPINDPTDSDLIAPYLSDQDMPTISVYNWDPPGPAFLPEWRLLQGDGTPAPSGGSWTSTPTRSCGPLPAAGGPYRIEVRDAGQDSNGICRVDVEGCTAVSSVPGRDGPPASFTLRLNSSNPVRAGGFARVIFAIDASRSARTTLDVIDASGRQVTRLLDRVLERGRHLQEWNASGVSAGLYLCRLRTGGSTVVTKVVVVD